MRIVDLFSGCGGMSLGFQKAGFEIVSAFDNWDQAIEVYRANFSHPIFKMNLMDVERAVDSVSAYNPDMIIGGCHVRTFLLRENVMKIMDEVI